VNYVVYLQNQIISMNPILQEVKAIIAKENIKQKELSILWGDISIQQVSSRVNGHTQISLTELNNLCEAYKYRIQFSKS